MLPYPFSYFSSIWGFRKPLSKRFGLNWFQLLFTSIFLISLSMVPIAIQNSSQETYPLETFIDNVYEPLTDKVVQDLSEHATIVDGNLTYTGTTSQAPSLVIGPSQSKELPKDLQLHFDTNELVISKENRQHLKEHQLLDGIMRKAHRNRPLTEAQTKRNRYLSKTRYVVEQSFGTLHRKFRYARAAYFGLIKVSAQSHLKAMCLNLLKAANRLSVPVAA